VQNGDFEQGDNGDWTLSITPTASLTLISNQLPEGIQPHAGTWAAWLGGADNVTTEISQTITLPDRPMRLVYYYWIDSSEVFCGGFDISMLHINGTSIDIMVLCTEKNTGGWVQDEQDMSAYAGQTVTISFNVINDTVSSSNLYLDDISLEEAP
jgi:bacillopeptidase F (M6 metalloprotease family)